MGLRKTPFIHQETRIFIGLLRHLDSVVGQHHTKIADIYNIKKSGMIYVCMHVSHKEV